MNAGAGTPRVLPTLAGLARARPLQFGASSAVVFSHYLLQLVPGLVLQAFFDDLSGHQQAGFGPYTLLALLAAIAVVSALQAFAAQVEPTLRQATALLMRRNLLAATLRRPAARALPGSAGEAIGRMRDDVQAVSEALTYALDPLGMVVMLGTALFVLARVSALVTLAVVLPALVTMFLVNTLARRLATYRRRALQAGADVTGLIGETFAALVTIKGAGAEERIARHFEALGEARLHAVTRDVVLSQAVDSLATNLSVMAVGGILLLIPRELRSGSFTVGDFALFVSYLTRFSTVTIYVGEYSRIYRQLLVSLSRLAPLLLGTPGKGLVEPHPLEVSRAAPAQPADARGLPLRELRIVRLTHEYPGGRGIRDVDLVLGGGTFTVVTGPVGAGKTTLLRCLLGLLPADGGAIYWNGEPVEAPDLWMVPPRCAFTPQVPRLFTASIEENVLLGLDGGRELALAAAGSAALATDLARLEAGLETAVGPRGIRLSGGQVQRVAAARMLVRDAALMVFDDLSSALDVHTEAELWRNLRATYPEATLLAVSHRPAVLDVADQVLRLAGGRIAPAGP